MEQIIGFIIVAIVGAAWDAWRKHRRAKRLSSGRNASRQRPPAITLPPAVTPPPPIERSAAGSLQPPAEEGGSAFNFEPVAEEVVEAEPVERAGEADVERWRRAIIDGEIIARRF